MKTMSAAAALTLAAVLASASPALAQKGKGNGKGGPARPAPGRVLPPGPGKASPARPFEHPKTGNSLPQATLDRLPPGLRGKPENHPGLTNHLRKLGYDTTPPTDLPNPSPGQYLTPVQPPVQPPVLTPTQPSIQLPVQPPVELPAQMPARLFPQPNSGNSLTQDILDRLPPGLRDMPENHPGLANHLRQFIPPPTATPSAPAPVLPQPVQPWRGFLRRR